MSEADDRIFLKRFSLVLVALAFFAVVIILVSIGLHGTVDREESAALEAGREQRLMPVAGVYAGETGRAAAMAAREAEASQQVAAAFDGSLDGALIYEQACATCHAVGAAGAPEMVASAWVGRVEKGTEQLVANAINGIGAMPPRGGRRDLTDEQIEVSVTYMLDMLE